MNKSPVVPAFIWPAVVYEVYLMRRTALGSATKPGLPQPDLVIAIIPIISQLGVGKKMNVWFTINLGDAMLAGESLDHIKKLFLSEYEKAKNPEEMAVFIRHESEGCLHCEVKIYFSPASAVVAEAVDAIPCNKPSPDGLGLLAGSEESWSVFFPGNGV